ncbi:MAG: polyprenyl synthetase family protein [Candidatus Hydrothermarchaeaceae archaeon]
MVSHEELLQHYTELVEEGVASYFQSHMREYDYHPFMARVYSQMAEYLGRGGKRLASASTLIAYKGYTGSLDERIKEVAVGIEMYRHSILAHDDLVDRDDHRRGGRALHKLHDGRLGEAVAIFAGNMMYALALEIFMNSGFGEDLKQRVVKLFTREYAEVNESQILDVHFEGAKPTEGEWYSMAAKRAASLFKSTILAGAVFGEAGERDILTLREAAENIGYAFDIQDDIIGTFASEEQYGRPVGGDVALRKKPLHVVYALERSTEEEARILEGGDIKGAMDVIRSTGGLDMAKTRSREHAAKARELLKKTSMDAESKEFFYGFIEYVSESLEWYV